MGLIHWYIFQKLKRKQTQTCGLDNELPPPPPPPMKVGQGSVLHLLSAQPPFALTDLAGVYLSKVLPRRPVPASAEWDTKHRLDSALM